MAVLVAAGAVTLFDVVVELTLGLVADRLPVDRMFEVGAFQSCGEFFWILVVGNGS